MAKFRRRGGFRNKRRLSKGKSRNRKLNSYRVSRGGIRL